jgi:hypothetical protein
MARYWLLKIDDFTFQYAESSEIRQSALQFFDGGSTGDIRLGSASLSFLFQTSHVWLQPEGKTEPKECFIWSEQTNGLSKR